MAIIINIVTIFISFSEMSLIFKFEYISRELTINLFNIIPPKRTNIVSCLFEENIRKVSPPIINKSDNLIFVFVNVRTAINITIVHKIGTLFINVNGKCSFMFSVVFPCIVLYKYVNGVLPIGVKNPVKIHIIITSINHFTFLFLFNKILYIFWFSLYSFLFLFDSYILSSSCFNLFTFSCLLLLNFIFSLFIKICIFL